MAITNTQRQLALQAILQAAIQEAPPAGQGLPLATLIPGVTAAQVLTFLVNAIGTTADAYFTEALAAIVTALNATLTSQDGVVSRTQAAITAYTVV